MIHERTPVTIDGQLQLNKIPATKYTQDNNGNTYIVTENDPNIYKFNANSKIFTTLTPSNSGPSIIRVSDFNCHVLNDENIIYLDLYATKVIL